MESYFYKRYASAGPELSEMAGNVSKNGAFGVYLWDWAKALILMVLVVIFVLFMWGCAVCTTQSTRCSGNVAEICDSRGHWRMLMDCDEVEGETPFSCQETIDEGQTAHTCLPGDDL